jgi:DNA polymerase-3 subunit epsilon
MDFCAIDFETANYSRGSACSIGMVKVRDGRIVEEFHSLINQEDTWFRPDWTEEIHGITAEMTATAPRFAELWPRLESFIEGLSLAAHNASFDLGVLAALLEDAEIEWEFPESICSLKTARATWPKLSNHRLDGIAGHLGLELDHHEALSDARACALILIAAEKAREV